MNQPTNTGGFDFNRPTIIGLLYLSSFLLGITGLVGLVLAFVWKGESRGSWEETHYTYLINTFWIGLIGSIVGAVLTLLLIGFLILIATAILVIVRTVLSLTAAQRQMAMPDPNTWKW